MLLKNFDFKIVSVEEILKKLFVVVVVVDIRVVFVVVVFLEIWLFNRENIL